MDPLLVMPLKAVSTNKIWVGKRWLSPEAKKLKRACQLYTLSIKEKLLPLPEGDLTIAFRFGVSRDMDTSNCIKIVEDGIATALGINDKRFRGHIATKSRVAKGDEYIAFTLLTYDDRQFLQVQENL